MKILFFFYLLTLLILTIYSYGFVDPNLTFSTYPLYKTFHQPLFELVFFNRPLSTIIFVILILLFTIYYLVFSVLAKTKRLTRSNLKWLIGLTVGILLVSYPAFSHDIFNYILTAKVTYFYGENPYIVMPIEFTDDPNLAFTRAANKIALYGPSWILFTFITHFLGFNNIIATIFSFKLFIAGFYIGAILVIYQISKNFYQVVLFALNPLVLVETLVSAHNDIFMMFFALFSYYLLRKRKIILATISLGISILVKYATIVLLPIFLYIVFKTIRKEKIDWHRVHLLSGWTLFLVFLLSPLREEFYPWYVIWFLIFVVLMKKANMLFIAAITLSITTLLRYLPVLYTGEYAGITPVAKEVLTFVPFIGIIAFFIMKRFFPKKRYAP